MSDEIERLRKLVPERPDFHLNNWGRWRRGYTDAVGYSTHSTCLQNLGGVSSPEASDHVYESGLGWMAEVADSIIIEMELKHRLAFSHVYEAAVWRMPRMAIEDILIEAAEIFWIKARKRSLA